MTKYEELKQLGNNVASAFGQTKFRCETFAEKLVRSLERYLECPAGSAFYREILEDGRQGERIWGIDKAFPHHKIKLLHDDFWCIGLEFCFGSIVVTERLGVKPSGDGFAVRHGEKIAELRADDDAGFKRFFDIWYDGIKAEMSTPYAATKPRIGFRA